MPIQSFLPPAIAPRPGLRRGPWPSLSPSSPSFTAPHHHLLLVAPLGSTQGQVTSAQKGPNVFLHRSVLFAVFFCLSKLSVWGNSHIRIHSRGESIGSSEALHGTPPAQFPNVAEEPLDWPLVTNTLSVDTSLPGSPNPQRPPPRQGPGNN